MSSPRPPTPMRRWAMRAPPAYEGCWTKCLRKSGRLDRRLSARATGRTAHTETGRAEEGTSQTDAPHALFTGKSPKKRLDKAGAVIRRLFSHSACRENGWTWGPAAGFCGVPPLGQSVRLGGASGDQSCSRTQESGYGLGVAGDYGEVGAGG